MKNRNITFLKHMIKIANFIRLTIVPFHITGPCRWTWPTWNFRPSTKITHVNSQKFLFFLDSCYLPLPPGKFLPKHVGVGRCFFPRKHVVTSPRTDPGYLLNTSAWHTRCLAGCSRRPKPPVLFVPTKGGTIFFPEKLNHTRLKIKSVHQTKTL